MIALSPVPGYETLNRIYESASSVVFRAYREEDGRPVVLKVLRGEYPSLSEILRYKQEYRITAKLGHVQGVIRVHGQERYGNTLVMILEDFGADSLEILLRSVQFDLLEHLRISIRIVEALGRIHSANVIHKDVTPSNIVYNPETELLKFIDFGISTELSREEPVIKSPDVLEGTLAYISPEQTGRMNRWLDYRTDYYSLGATLYELFTGQPPFETADALGMVHSHIAKQPLACHVLNSNVPEAVSRIVAKLLAKNPEERYQSSLGIKADLTEVLRGLEHRGTVEPFGLGRHDFCQRFQIPETLYGRDSERKILLDLFERVSKGAKEMVLVSGHPGIGKTSLVKEIYRSATEYWAYFSSGKFDQFGRNVPYSAIVKAFTDLIRQVLTESEARLARWRKNLMAELGDSAQVITNVIPELELIIGPQPAVPEIGPSASLNRFNRLMTGFIRVFCCSDRPLVLFLDDLQWADQCSMKLIELIMADDEMHGILLIGAFRSNEVNSSHPLNLFMEALPPTGVEIHQILLRPLNLGHVTELIAASLNWDEESVLPLAKLVLAKTAGNPFFTHEFLKSMYEGNPLNLDLDTGQWQWDLHKIEAQALADNVVELMSGKISKLAGETQMVVKMAACIGNRFDLGTLATVCETTESRTLDALKVPLFEGLVVPIGDSWKFVDLDLGRPEGAVPAEFKFSHDRIQQAAYSLISDSEKPDLHWRIGQLMFHDLASLRQNGKLFDIVNHLNLGIQSQTNHPGKEELARLNLRAGRKSMGSAAFEHAFQYFRQGIGLQDPDCWETDYDITLQLHLEGGQAAYLSMDFEEMGRLTQAVLDNARSVVEKSRAYEIRIQALIARNEMGEAVKAARDILRLLGVRVPEKPGKLEAMFALLKTKLVLLGKAVEDLDELPEMTRPESLAATRIMASVAQAAYAASPEMIPCLLFNAIQLSLKYGNAPESAFMYASYGLVLCGLLGQIELGYRFGRMALRLSDRFNAGKLKIRTSTVVHFFINPWKEHYADLAHSFEDIYHRALETGDLEDAGLAAYIYCTGSYRTGRELPLLEAKMAPYCDSIRSLKQQSAFRLLVVYRQAVLNLMGESDDPCRLVGKAYDEETMLPLHRQANDRSAICVTYLNKLQLCYLFERYREALEGAAATKAHLDGVRGTAAVPVFYFYDSLARLAVYRTASALEQKAIHARVKSNQRKMKKWARHGPMNHLHKFLLVEAEHFRVRGKHAEAEECYDRSIAAARDQGYINEQALASELAAKYYLARGRHRVATTYMLDARSCYERWGAQAKVRDLQERYGFLDLGECPTASVTKEKGTSTSTLTSGPRRNLDLEWVVRASQALSGEIVLGELLTRLMNIVIENAGAQKGLLVLESYGELFVEAEAWVDPKAVTILQSVPIEKSHELSASIVRYVARTRESLVLNDAALPGRFVTDPYVLQRKPKSILCFPLVHKSRLSAIVYLENNLTPGAFTPDRLEILKLLGSQAAISLENARLYDQLENRVAERTALLQKANTELTVEIAEKEEARRSLIHAKMAAETANGAKSEFLATMSHELRTPLNAIIGFSQMLEDQARDVLDKEHLEWLGLVVKSGHHLLQLINDILDLAKVESGKLTLERSPVNVAKLVENSLLITKEKASRHGLIVTWEIEDDLARSDVYVDEVKLKQIMFNLLSNATKFTPTGGSIAVEVIQRDGSLVISVSDTGIGIESEDQARVFEAFEQVEHSLARQKGGTGLGLALTRKLVELHGGNICVESPGPGKGSTFTFTIPHVTTP